MKDNLLIQYGAIRETIKANVKTISMLVDQAESLKGVIETITENTIKESLQDQLSNIENTIGDLIKQTDELFDKYDTFVKDVFSSK